MQQDSIIENPPDLLTISPCLAAAVLQAEADVTRAEAAALEACERITREVQEGHENNTDASLTSTRIQGHIRDGAQMEKALDKARKRAKKARKLAALAASKPQTGVNKTQNE